MDIDPFDPSQADTLVNLPAMAQRLTLPGMGGNGSSMTCYTDDDGITKCFTFRGENEVSCKGDECFVAFETMNQKLLGNGRRLKKLDLDVLVIPNGLSTSIVLVGSIPRKRLRTLKRVVGDVKITEADELPSLTAGIPKPPGKCHLNPLSGTCSQYLSSDDWLYIPGIGFKRRIDVMKNPRTLLKSEVLDEMKKAGGKLVEILRRKKSRKTSATLGENSPMHERNGKAIKTGDPVHGGGA